MIYRAKVGVKFIEAPDRIYPVGSLFTFDDSERGEELKKNPKFEAVEVHEMSFAGPDYSAMTKSELQGLLDELGVEYHDKATKAELIELL